jgi:hypothetical protein
MLGLGSGTAANAEEILPPPASLSADFLTLAANKAECVSSTTIAQMMIAEQAVLGGRTLLIVDGVGQAFADQWRC